MVYKGEVYRRIMVIGCSGSGKSTFSRALSEKTGIPVIHLDAHWWREGWTNASKEEFDSWQESAVRGESWIIDGNYNRTLETRLKYADMVVDFRIPRYKCLSGVVKRYLKYRNKTRPDMGEGCNEQLDFEFIKFIWSFNKKNAPENDRKIGKYPEVKHIIFKSRKEADLFLRESVTEVY